MLNTVVNALLGIGYWAVATRLFTKSEVGTSAGLISLMVLLAALSQFNLSNGLPRLLQMYRQSSRRIVVLAYAACSASGAALATIVAIVLSGNGHALGEVSPAVLILFVAGVALWTVFTLQDAVLTGLRKAHLVPTENLAFGVLKLASLVLVGVHLGQDGIFVSWILAVPLVVVPLNILIIARFLPDHARNEPHRKPERRTLLRFVGLEYIGSLCNQAATNFLPVLVVSSLGSEANASFYSAWILIYALDTVASNFALSFTVEAAREPTRQTEFLRNVEVRTAQVLIPILVVVGLSAPALLSVFGSSYAAEGTDILRIMLIGTAARAVNLLAIGLHRARHASGHVVKIQGLVALLVLGLAAVLVNPLGIAGIAWAWSIGSLLVACLSLRDLIHYRNQPAVVRPDAASS